MVATARNGPRTSNRQLESSNRSARGADWPKNYIFEEREGSRVFKYDIRKIVVLRDLSVSSRCQGCLCAVRRCREAPHGTE